jgi:excisionase family DNA binding protein
MTAAQSSLQLSDLVRDPSLAAQASRDCIPGLLAQLSAMQCSVAARLIATSQDETTDGGEARLLTVDEAAARLGVSADWLYRRTKSLPFVVRVGRHVRFSANGIDRYIRNRMGR